MNSFARHPVTKDSSDDLQIKENVLRSGFHSTVVNDQTAMHDATSRSTCIAVDDFCGDDGYGNECQWTRLCRNSQNSNADEYVSLHGQINSGKRCYENEVSCCIAEPIYNKENHSSNEKRILAGTRISQTDTPFGSEPSTRQKHISLNGNKMHSVNLCLAGVLPSDKDFLVTCSPNYSSCHIDNQVSPVSFSASCNPVTQLNTLNLNYAESATDGILSNESVFDSPTATISCATSSSAELVPVSPLLSVNSCSEEIAAVVPQAAYDNGYCSDEVCYSASSECDGLQHAVSPELVPTFKCINHFDFSARDLRLKEMQHPLQHSDGNRQKDSCTTKITIAEGHPLVNVSSKPMIESESVPECCLVSKWLSAVSAAPVAVTSIQDNNSFRNKPAKDATTYSEQHNSTDSANAALFSLDNQLLDVHSLTCLETCTVQTVSNALHLRLQEGEEQADEQNLSCSPIEGNPLMYTSNSGQGNTCMTVNGSLQIDETDCLASDTSDQQNNCDLYRGNDLAGISSNMNQCQFCQECVSIDAAVINPFKTLNDPLAEQVSHNILPEVCAVKAVQTSCEKPEVDGTKCILFRAGFAGTRCRICEQDFQQTSVIPLSHSVNGHTKRIYKVGLNVFNIISELGIEFLIDKKFIAPQPDAIAKFLFTRKGLSRKAIGEYLSNTKILTNPQILKFYLSNMDFAGMCIDDALRKFLSYFLLPGESQKIEQFVTVFASRYSECNPEVVSQFRGGTDTIFLLSFATVLLNTDLHHRCVSPRTRMSVDDFIHNLRGTDNGSDVNESILADIYARIKLNELQPDADHVSRVAKLESLLFSSHKLTLALPHRRLISYCQMVEVQDPCRRQRSGVRRRDLFLFNDLLLVTKYMQRRRQEGVYTFRQAISLSSLAAYLFETQYFPFGVRLYSSCNFDVLLTVCAATDFDRNKFISDLHESVLEWADTGAVLKMYDQKQSSKGTTPSSYDTLSRASQRTEVSDRKQKATSLVVEIVNSHSVRSSRSLDSGLMSSRSNSTGSYQDGACKNTGTSLPQYQNISINS